MVRRVGDYLLGDKLGDGAYSQVVSATHGDTGEPVAVKIIPRDRLPPGSRASRMVRQEIENLRALPPHRNVVALRRVIRSSQNLYLVMEKAGGGDLFERLQLHGALSEDSAREVMVGLVAAVRHCHRHGVCHRDLKPENILVSDDAMTIKLADFGMSLRHSLDGPEPMLSDAVGTSSYMAPEILRGALYLGSKADVWSLGVVLYILLLGSFPFSSVDFKRVLERINTRDPQRRLKAFSPQLRALMRGLLDKDPATRFTIHAVAAHPWFRLPAHTSSASSSDSSSASSSSASSSTSDLSDTNYSPVTDADRC